MSSTRVFHLSNLAAGQEFDLTVAEGADVLAAAQAHLAESGLPGELQQGFYLSVHPRTPDGDALSSTHPTTGTADGGPVTDASDPTEVAILA